MVIIDNLLRKLFHTSGIFIFKFEENFVSAIPCGFEKNENKLKFERIGRFK